jgi:TetR/AcrR family transcriptional regulator, fatty acid metabolism regulator protein
MNDHSSPKGGDKRERILASAMRVFARKGFFGAKVADIAADAGIADGTIYLYFKSKDDLLISFFESQMERFKDAFEDALGAASAPEKLRRIIAAYMSLVAENRVAAEVVTIELRQSAKFMKEYANPRFAAFLKMLASVIDEGQRQGTLAPGMPPPVAARAIFGLLDELTLMWVTDRSGRLDIQRVADWIGDLVLQGLERRAA